jgi:hypothetical protein
MLKCIGFYDCVHLNSVVKLTGRITQPIRGENNHNKIVEEYK